MPKQKEEKLQTFAQNSQVCTLAVMSKRRMPWWMEKFLLDGCLVFQKWTSGPFLVSDWQWWDCHLKVWFWLWWLSCLCFYSFGSCGARVFGCGGCRACGFVFVFLVTVIVVFLVVGMVVVVVVIWKGVGASGMQASPSLWMAGPSSKRGEWPGSGSWLASSCLLLV